MSGKTFFIGLAASFLLSFVAHFILASVFPIQEHLTLSLLMISLMVGLSLLIFFLSQKATKSDRKGSFINVIVINVMLKLFLSILLIVVYAKVYQPDNKFFVLPFLAIYLIFTIFETYFLSKQSRIVK